MSPQFFRISSAVITGIICWLVLWLLNTERVAVRQLEEAQLLEAYASDLNKEFDRALISVRVLSVLSREDDLSHDQFQNLAGALYNQLDGILSLQLAPDGVVSFMYPDDLSSGIRGQKLLEHPVTKDSAKAAIASRQILIDGPRMLNQGGRGIVVRLPIFQQEQFWGFATAVFRLNDLLARIRLKELKTLGFDFNIWVASESEPLQSLFDSGIPEDATDIRSLDIEVANQIWTLGIRSTDSSLISYISWAEILVAILITWLASALAYSTSQLYRHRNELSLLVDERTVDLKQSEVNLKQAQRVARLGSWYKPPGTGVRYLSDQAMHILQVNESTQDLTRYMGLISPEYQAGFEAFCSSQAKGNRSVEYMINTGSRLIWIREVVEFDPLSQKLIGTIQDITRDKQNQAVIWHQANIDDLTELPNINYSKNLLADNLNLLDASSDSVALMLFDIQHFKVVNDSYGKKTGDQLLIAVAERLSHAFPDALLIGRFTADLFLVALKREANITEKNPVGAVVEKQFESPLHINEVLRYVSFNIGIAYWPKDGATVDELLQSTEIALHAAKAHGEQGHICHYSSSLLDSSKEQDELSRDLRVAIRENEIFMVYQPVVDATSESVVGVEALVRWQHPVKGFIGPDKFIPIAERNGLIFSLGKAIFRCVSKDSLILAEQGLGELRININISRSQFFDDGFSDFLAHELKTGFSAGQKITLEVTESYELMDYDALNTVISKVDNEFLQWSLDDFGTGYSSYSAIGLLPVDNIKIDRSFISAIEQSEVDQAIVRNIIAMAHTLKKSVTAEGIEKQEQALLLKQMGCDYFQGYFYSKPLAPDTLIHWYHDNKYVNDTRMANH